MRISQFVKENPILSVSTLGIAPLGYIGYRAVRRLTACCRPAEKVHFTAQEALYPMEITDVDMGPYTISYCWVPRYPKETPTNP